MYGRLYRMQTILIGISVGKSKEGEGLGPQTVQLGKHVLGISNALYILTAYSKNMLEFVSWAAMSVGTVGIRPAKCPLLSAHNMLFQTEALHALLFQ